MNYKTTELEIASFLKARGYKLLGAHLDRRVVAFEFEPQAAADVQAYFTGEPHSVREVFEAHRALRALIQQVREHQLQTERRR